MYFVDVYEYTIEHASTDISFQDRERELKMHREVSKLLYKRFFSKLLMHYTSFSVTVMHEILLHGKN